MKCSHFLMNFVPFFIRFSFRGKNLHYIMNVMKASNNNLHPSENFVRLSFPRLDFNVVKKKQYSKKVSPCRE